MREFLDKLKDRFNEFDINKVLKWDAENIRKYKLYIKRFDNQSVLLNLMLLDKQLQDLQENYQNVRYIRENQKDLSNFAHSLNTNMKTNHNKYLIENSSSKKLKITDIIDR